MSQWYLWQQGKLSVFWAVSREAQTLDQGKSSSFTQVSLDTTRILHRTLSLEIQVKHQSFGKSLVEGYSSGQSRGLFSLEKTALGGPIPTGRFIKTEPGSPQWCTTGEQKTIITYWSRTDSCMQRKDSFPWGQWVKHWSRFHRKLCLHTPECFLHMPGWMKPWAMSSEPYLIL